MSAKQKKVIISFGVILMVCAAVGSYFALKAGQPWVSQSTREWKTYTDERHKFTFQYPPEFELESEAPIDIVSRDEKPWVAISLLHSDEAIIRMDMDHPGFGLEGMEAVDQSTILINNISMSRQIFLNEDRDPKGSRWILYAFARADNGFNWFLNMSSPNAATEETFQKIVESFRFL